MEINIKTDLKTMQKKWSELMQPRLVLPVLLFFIIAVIVLAALLLQKSNSFDRRGSVAATVNGQPISMAELFDAMYAQGGQDVLNQLITRRLILAEAEKIGISVSDKMLDQAVESIIDESFQGSEEDFLEALYIYGIDLQKFREDTRLSMLVQEMARSRVNVTDDDIRAYLVDHPERLYKPDVVQVRHILLDTREKAEEVITLLREGWDFEVLAAQYSLDLSSRDMGGDLGDIRRGFMEERFEEAAFALYVGVIGGPIETMSGYHVIEVLNRRVETLLQFEDVKDEVREELIEEKMYVLIREIVGNLKEEAEIEYFIDIDSD